MNDDDDCVENDFQGLYRGVVESNVDPLKRGRLLVSVSDVLDGLPVIWAEPSTPIAGLASGMYVVPSQRAGVWVQFAGGDPERAVWTGFWRGGPTEIPSAARTTPPGTPQIVLGTPSQNSIVITDLPGTDGGIQIQLRGPGGPFIRLNDRGIELSNGLGASIKLEGNKVTINNGALEVT
jgi:hypothetical protein